MSDSNSSEEKGFFGRTWDTFVDVSPYIAAGAAVAVVGVITYNYFTDEEDGVVEEVFEAISCTDF